MRFWDTSAVVPLLLQQEATAVVGPLLEKDPAVVAWWGTTVECASAVARLRREARLTAAEETRTLELLGTLRGSWLEVLPSEDVRGRCLRLLRVHALRASDALQLAAALAWSGDPAGVEFVTLDERLAHAARLEGFAVIP